MCFRFLHVHRILYDFLKTLLQSLTRFMMLFRPKMHFLYTVDLPFQTETIHSMPIVICSSSAHDQKPFQMIFKDSFVQRCMRTMSFFEKFVCFEIFNPESCMFNVHEHFWRNRVFQVNCAHLFLASTFAQLEMLSQIISSTKIVTRFYRFFFFIIIAKHFKISSTFVVSFIFHWFRMSLCETVRNFNIIKAFCVPIFASDFVDFFWWRNEFSILTQNIQFAKDDVSNKKSINLPSKWVGWTMFNEHHELKVLSADTRRCVRLIWFISAKQDCNLIEKFEPIDCAAENSTKKKTLKKIGMKIEQDPNGRKKPILEQKHHFLFDGSHFNTDKMSSSANKKQSKKNHLVAQNEWKTKPKRQEINSIAT